ncbi:hypothetical protein [Thermococcus sp.]|uniref:hypothetical protein n=1 Tax=Thermococcus sp. TaxID=35749 RepID=UPI0025F68595|nr:hypothetical protein [Thermococcus sp.]
MRYAEFDGVLGKFQNNPLDIKNSDTLEYLREVFSFHLHNSPYWMGLNERLTPDLDEIFQGDLKEVFENLLNTGLMVHEEYLRTHWLEFVPGNYRGHVRFYQSSGTTRERAIGHWDGEYLHYLHTYLRAALDSIYGLNRIYTEEHQMRTLAHGPYGWYQDEISELVWSYGGVLYFIGMETDGIKKVLAERGIGEVLRLLDPLVKYTHRVMEADRINTVRSAPPLMTLFEPYWENIETAIISGVGIDYSFFKYLSEKFSETKLIPMYGYYGFGDLVGIMHAKSFWYYPNYPFTVVFPVRNDGGYDVVEYGERGQVGMLIARPELLIVKLEDETAVRTPPQRPFRWDGFGDPERRVVG